MIYGLSWITRLTTETAHIGTFKSVMNGCSDRDCVLCGVVLCCFVSCCVVSCKGVFSICLELYDMKIPDGTCSFLKSLTKGQALKRIMFGGALCGVLSAT